MRSKTVVLALTSCVLALAPVMVSAKSCDSTEGRPMMKKQFSELKLTADQKDKLKALRKEGMEAAKPLFDQMKAIREKAKTELLKAEPSTQALDNFASQLGDLHKQLVQSMHSQALKAKAILTPEQFSKMVNFEWMGPGPGMPRMHKEKDSHGPDKDND